MNAEEALAQIQKIVRERTRTKDSDTNARDLARYDRIVRVLQGSQTLTVPVRSHRAKKTAGEAPS